MSIKTWFRERKERRLAKKQAKLAKKLGAEPDKLEKLDEAEAESTAAERWAKSEAGSLSDLGAETEGLEQPETRFTEEYAEFLKEKEAAEAARAARAAENLNREQQ